MTDIIGLLHPGEMGTTVGAAARANDVQVVWASDGRGPETRDRAEAAGLTDVRSLSALVERSRIILGVCPPHAATELARAVAGHRFSGVYVDANAVSPATVRDVRQIVEAGGACFVDGGIIGPPALTPGTTRLYLSGSEAARVAACFRRGPLEACVLDGPPGAASALKMAYAAWTKGSAALLIAIRTLAINEGVDAALIREWDLSQAGLPNRSAGAVRSNAAKAWRFQRRNGGDCRHLRRRRPAGRLPPRSGRSLSANDRLQGCGDPALGRRRRGPGPGGSGQPQDHRRALSPFTSAESPGTAHEGLPGNRPSMHGGTVALVQCSAPACNLDHPLHMPFVGGPRYWCSVKPPCRSG